MSVLRQTAARASRSSPTRARKAFLVNCMDHVFDMDKEDAEATAALVMAHFGRDDEVDDDTLTTEVRSIFYTLESKRILTFRRFEYRDDEGRILRGFRWRLNDQFRHAVASEGKPAPDSVYESLPADVWQRRTAA